MTPKKSTATCLNRTNGEQVCERGEKTPCCTSYHDFEAFLRHFVFSTIINNFSTFFRRYVQPQKYFKKVENLTIYGPVFEFFGKKWSLSKKKIVFDVFEAFLWYVVFSTIIDIERFLFSHFLPHGSSALTQRSKLISAEIFTHMPPHLPKERIIG